MSQDPRQVMAESRMTTAQVMVIAITVCLNAVDGFDVLSISYASPGISTMWGIDRAALGFVLSMELIGMAIGSMLFGGFADRFGRRDILIACTAVITFGMAMAATVGSVYQLCVWRVVTGLGIGGMLAITNAVAAEVSNAKYRSLAISTMLIGYPLGAVAGGMVAAKLLAHSDWHAVFDFGASISALLIPAIFLGIPESVVWLCEKQPARALEKVNRALRRLGYAAATSLPAPLFKASKAPFMALFAPALRKRSVLMTATYSLHIMTFYFIIKWVPKIVVDMGFAPAAAAGVLVWANVGGVVGTVLLGLLGRLVGLRFLVVGFLIASTLMVMVFGHGQASLAGLSLICAITGFCTNGSVAGIYVLLARAFPAELRASGTGFAIGIGRGGALLAPILAGYLFHFGFGLQSVAIIMSVGSLAAAGCLIALPLHGGTTDQGSYGRGLPDLR